MTPDAAILRLQLLFAAPWFVAAPTLAGADWRATLIATLAVTFGCLATIYGVIVAWESTALLFVRRDATIVAQRAQIGQLNATGGADVRYAQAQDALIVALRRENTDLRTNLERLEAENVALKRRFGTRSEDKL